MYQPLPPPAPGTPANYALPFIESGEYTVAFTCRFGVDADPTRGEYDPASVSRPKETPTMRFTVKPARITAGVTTRIDAP